MAARRALLIAGRWIETGTTNPIRNPYNGEVLAEACQAGEAEAEEAIRAAASAFAVSRRLPAHQRADALHKIGGGSSTRQEKFSRWLFSGCGQTDDRRPP